MRPQDYENWKKQRAKGPMYFILTRTTIYIGVFLVLYYTVQNSRFGIPYRSMTTDLLLYAIVMLLLFIVQWFVRERAFKEENRKS